MRRLKKWFGRNTEKINKLIDKKSESIIKKQQIALKILNMPEVERRKVQEPVTIERRVEIYDYHHKLA